MSLSDALAHCAPDEKIYVIGGAQIYSQALEIADELDLTLSSVKNKLYRTIERQKKKFDL